MAAILGACILVGLVGLVLGSGGLLWPALVGGRRRAAAVLAGAFGLFLVVAALTPAALRSLEPSRATASPAEHITLSQFLSLPDGCTYADAVRILGRAGTEVSRSNLADSVTVMYSWTNPDASNMNAMFQNDRLVSKAHFGLR